jgi:hypothetical protein
MLKNMWAVKFSAVWKSGCLVITVFMQLFNDKPEEIYLITK